jgi:RNA polymerase sigma-70 factor (ECF subfamily)
MAIHGVMDETALAAVDAALAAPRLMDEDAFRAFYDRTSRSVWLYLARVTGDRQAADDLLQETYYRFFRLGNVHEDEAHRRNSLFCIATNVARDTWRRRSRTPQRVDFPEYAEEAAAVDERIAQRCEESLDLARAMERLKPLQREMLWLAYALGASHDEIAEILGLKSQSIRTLLFRARKKLAGFLGGPAGGAR